MGGGVADDLGPNMLTVVSQRTCVTLRTSRRMSRGLLWQVVAVGDQGVASGSPEGSLRSAPAVNVPRQGRSERKIVAGFCGPQKVGCISMCREVMANFPSPARARETLLWSWRTLRLSSVARFHCIAARGGDSWSRAADLCFFDMKPRLRHFQRRSIRSIRSLHGCRCAAGFMGFVSWSPIEVTLVIEYVGARNASGPILHFSQDVACTQYIHLTRFYTRNFCRAWAQAHIAANLCGRSHAMFLSFLDPPLTAPSQSSSTSSSLLFPSNWTPTATPLFGRFAERSPLTGYEPNAPLEVSSADATTPMKFPSRHGSLESTCDDLATTLDASEAGGKI